ncbi:hypothetical protein KAR91_71460 [Candidatus Pacearchaeota archaeon]|nr:hypothetical protein [Candidatus Pacearchaeota archaeon]
MRYCKLISTNKIIGKQSGGHKQEHLSVLIQNAITEGYDESEITAFFEDRPRPSVYHNMHDGIDWIEDADLKEAGDVEALRREGIQEEQAASGLKKITVSKAFEKIDQIFENKTTVAQVRTATVLALKKMIPYILE